MAYINCVVDTTPMAESIHSVSNHVTGTTTAVVAMQTAVIASEKASADKICKNVDSGFYNLIRSQVSMKLAKSFTEMQAKLALLLEYKKTLMKTQERMDTDFHRVRAQYLHIFKGLDKALENRISQLNSSAVSIAESRKKLAMGMFERHVPESIVTSKEISSSEQQIAVTRLKSKADHSLGYLADKVTENSNYKTLMESMLDNTEMENEQVEYVPVIYASKQSTVVEDTFVLSLNYPEYLTEQTKNDIGLSILNSDENTLNKPKSDFERKNVLDEFQALMASTPMEQRVADTMMRLFQTGGL